jgi:hypothetical protein
MDCYPGRSDVGRAIGCADAGAFAGNGPGPPGSGDPPQPRRRRRTAASRKKSAHSVWWYDHLTAIYAGMLTPLTPTELRDILGGLEAIYLGAPAAYRPALEAYMDALALELMAQANGSRGYGSRPDRTEHPRL